MTRLSLFSKKQKKQKILRFLNCYCDDTEISVTRVFRYKKWDRWGRRRRFEQGFCYSMKKWVVHMKTSSKYHFFICKMDLPNLRYSHKRKNVVLYVNLIFDTGKSSFFFFFSTRFQVCPLVRVHVTISMKSQQTERLFRLGNPLFYMLLICRCLHRTKFYSIVFKTETKIIRHYLLAES
jgi:hypothetical protein